MTTTIDLQTTNCYIADMLLSICVSAVDTSDVCSMPVRDCLAQAFDGIVKKWQIGKKAGSEIIRLLNKLYSAGIFKKKKRQFREFIYCFFWQILADSFSRKYYRAVCLAKWAEGSRLVRLPPFKRVLKKNRAFYKSELGNQLLKRGLIEFRRQTSTSSNLNLNNSMLEILSVASTFQRDESLLIDSHISESADDSMQLMPHLDDSYSSDSCVSFRRLTLLAKSMIGLKKLMHVRRRNDAICDAAADRRLSNRTVKTFDAIRKISWLKRAGLIAV